MSAIADRTNRYLRLAIRCFEQADSPALKAKLRQMAGDYRGQALRLLELEEDGIYVRDLSPRTATR
jgi:hypothetical protein